MGHSVYDPGVKDRRPWNAGRIVGAKRALKLQQVWAIRFWLSNELRLRDRTMFDLAIDSKLRGCDIVKVKIGDLISGGRVRSRAIDRDFQELIYQIAGNARLQEQVRQLTFPLYRWQYYAFMEPSYARVSASEHEQIVAAILASDEAAAERAMRMHVRNSGHAIIEAAATAEARRARGESLNRPLSYM